MEKPYTIRFAEVKDLPQIIRLCKAHAAFEECDYTSKNKETQLEKSLFTNPVKLYCLVVAQEELLLGYATYMTQYATWDASEYIYMDCLFLAEGARSLGIGEKLIHTIKEEGKKLHCNHIQWQTPDFNTRAIKFYNRIGAFSKNKERFFLTI